MEISQSHLRQNPASFAISQFGVEEYAMPAKFVYNNKESQRRFSTKNGY